jgi:tRNA pseudouridine55 synthase
MVASPAKASLIGFLNIHKPKGITAHDVVAKVRRILKMKHVGHGGTLDPMATGVLPIGLNKACRLFQFMNGDKTYKAEILLGLRTTTDDVEGEIVEELPVQVTEDQVKTALKEFIGTIEQIPPAYSAIHYQGKRLYALARSGKLPSDIPKRTVTIYKMDLLSVELPVLTLRISVSAGTYIRSIARDLGESLSCGGCLKSLLRENAGSFALKNSITLEELENFVSQDKLEEAIIRPQDALPMPQITISDNDIQKVCQGQSLVLSEDLSASQEQRVLMTSNDKLIAIGRKIDGTRLQPEVVLADATKTI